MLIDLFAEPLFFSKSRFSKSLFLQRLDAAKSLGCADPQPSQDIRVAFYASD